MASILDERKLGGARSGWANFADLVRSFPGQARLALGTRGVLFATLAALLGIACCVVAFAEIALSLHRSDVDPQRQRARGVLTLDAAGRAVLRAILTSSTAIATADGETMSGAPWQRFVAALEPFCREYTAPPGTRLAATCADQPTFVRRIGAELAAADEAHRPVRRSVVRELIDLRNDFSELSQKVTGAADAAVDRLVDDYTNAILVLTLSTVGFAGAGVVLILLVGRTSMEHHTQWRRAADAASDAGRARDMLREVVEALPAGVVVYDRDERLLLFNSVASALNPALRDSAIGVTYEALVHESARRYEAAGLGPQPVESWIARFRARGSQRTQQAADGRWYDWSEKTTTSGMIVGLRTDVTDIKQHEHELEQTREEYQTLVDSLADVAYRLDVDTGKFIFVSAAAREVLGLSPESFIGTHFLEHIAPESQDQVRRTTTRAYDPADPGTFARFTMIGAGGVPRHVEVRARRRVDARGRVISTGVIRDVEERVQLEARLEQEVSRLRSIVGSGGALIMLVDRDLEVQMVNSGFTVFTGIAEADAVGRPLQELIAAPLDPARTKRTRFAVKLQDKSGRERLVAVTATPVIDDKGAVSSIVLLGVDDTERREAEQALYDAERFATVGEMAGTMAHEISQPLQVINIACATSLEELADAAQRRGGPDETMDFVQSKLERIGQQVDQASRIIGDLRAFVRGTASETPQPFNVNDALRSAIDVTDHGLREAGMTLDEALGEGLPSVVGDAGRLEQVLVNLINNARDAGGRTVRIATDTVRQEARTLVRIAVEDSGAGIPPDILPRLFNVFVSTKPRSKGTGLGLRICRRIVEEMGGTISAANRPAGGARFELLLPAKPPAAT